MRFAEASLSAIFNYIVVGFWVKREEGRFTFSEKDKKISLGTRKSVIVFLAHANKDREKQFEPFYKVTIWFLDSIP